MYPFLVCKDKSKQVIIFNCLGLSEEDIEVSLRYEEDNLYLVISGSRYDENTNTTFSVDSEFKVMRDRIKSIEKEVVNGVLYLYISMDKITELNIEIKNKKQ